MTAKPSLDDKIRLDKWLWAARFFKTRALAKEAIEGGKVHCQGERCKPGKEPKVGDELSIRQGFDERRIKVGALSAVLLGAGRGPGAVYGTRLTACSNVRTPPPCARPALWA